MSDSPLRIVLLALCLGLLGCESPIGPWKLEGTFEASVSGAIEDSHEGIALLRRGSEMDSSPYGIQLLTGGDDRETVHGLWFFFSERPRRGVYAVVPGSAGPGRVGALYAPVQFVSFNGAEGQLRITSSDPLRGSFRFLARSRTEEIVAEGGFSVP